MVEIVESGWAKRKYNRDRQVDTQWVFRGIERDTCEFFATLVDRRDAATLISIIDQYVLPSTITYSDECRAYNAINNDNNTPWGVIFI